MYTVTESTIDDILKTVQKFRILCVGRSGVGKSTLINRVFGIDKAHVSDYSPGEADIGSEFVSEQNKSFVLHDSKGYEPGDNCAYQTVEDFILRRCEEKELKDRLHAIWLCTETPTAGGRVFEAGDDKLVKLANTKGVPLVVVFTQYDRLVKTKIKQFKRSNKNATPEASEKQGDIDALMAFKVCVESLERSMKKFNVTMPPHAKVSDERGYEGNLSSLAAITRDVVQEKLKNDAWLMWAIAQRVSLPIKVDACIDKGVSYYYTALAGTVPGARRVFLRECLARVHKDIVVCWNLRNGDQILNSVDFQQLMLYLVQDVQEGSSSTAPPDISRIANFVSLVTTASHSVLVAPPIAIIGLSYFFVKWVSDAILDNIPSVERLIMAYSVDLILVLRSLFDFTLKLAGSTNWEVLKEAYELYERSYDVKKNHDSCRSWQTNRTLDRDGFRAKIRELVGEV